MTCHKFSEQFENPLFILQWPENPFPELLAGGTKPNSAPGIPISCETREPLYQAANWNPSM